MKFNVLYFGVKKNDIKLTNASGLEDMQKLVGGRIELYIDDPDKVYRIYVNEEGMLLKLKRNQNFSGRKILGNLIIVKEDLDTGKLKNFIKDDIKFLTSFGGKISNLKEFEDDLEEFKVSDGFFNE